MKPLKTALMAFVLALAPSIAGASHAAPEISDVTTGSGEQAVAYAEVVVHYTGWLMDGSKFDSSLDRDEPFRFTLSAGQVIPGWEMGVQGMRTGGKRILVIPPDLAYGKRGAGNVIPPDATLKFEVELIKVIPPKFKNIDNAELKNLLAKGTKIVDIRRPEEWKETGVVEGSKLLMSFDEKGNLSAGFLPELLSYAPRGEPVILICRTGSRTGFMSNLLSRKFGYSKVLNVENGIVEWIADGNPVVKP